MGADSKATDTGTTFVLQLASGEYGRAASRVAAELAASLPAATLERTWLELQRQVGAFRGVLRSRVVTRAGERSVAVTCQFDKGLLDVVMAVDDAGMVASLTMQLASDPSSYTPPAYVEPAAFDESDVIVGEGSDWPLPGTLTRPRASGPHPALVLVHGSGPQDRDETIGPNKVFRDLAWGLGSAGIATLRYDKRTHAYAERLTSEQALAMTIEAEVVDDAVRAVALLQDTTGIDSARVFVLGHSLGATLAPRIAQQRPTVAGLVVMAGMTRPFEDTILDQVTYLATLQGPATEADQARIADLAERVARVKDPSLAPDTPRDRLPLDVPAPYWLSLRGYRPADVARSLGLPMLVLQGGRDYQVTVDDDLPAWRDALGGGADATIKVYPTLNHAFMPGEGPPSPADYVAPGHVRQEVVADIARWIASRGR